jgi:WD40 repeat protein
MSDADLRAAIEGPAHQVGLLLEPGLVDLLVREVEGEPGALPLLSHALHETWQRREGRTLTVEGYQRTGGIRGSVAQSAERLYDTVPEEQRALLRDLLLRLVTPTPEGEPVRSRVPRRTVATDLEREQLIELLVRARLVTSDEQTVELAHESLARAWPRLRTWLDDDVEGQRILRHLALTADAWDGMERPDSELYRGVRLAQALDWQATANPDLTPAERAFLDASRSRQRAEAETTEQRLRQQARQNRRLRALLAGAAVLLVVAMVSGFLAVRQARRADRAAVAADARRVGAQALLAGDIDQSLLLAVEGVRLDDSTDTRANLMAALSTSPALIASTGGDGTGFISLELGADGEVAALGRAFSGLSFYSTRTRELLGTYDDVAAWRTEMRPDGRQLAVSTQEELGSNKAFPIPSVRLVDVATMKDAPVQLGGTPPNVWPQAVDYSEDGRFLAAAFDDSTVLVWDLASPQQPVQRISVPTYSYATALSADGSLVYVGSSYPPKVTVYDVGTGREVRSAAVPGGRLQLSPDGTLLAAVGGNEIVLLDATTLAEGRRLQGHTASVMDVQFSHDGALLASGSDDRVAIVWEVATGRRREELRSRGSVWGVAFSPDDATLYTAGKDGLLLTWDLRGDRRLIPRRLIAEPVTSGADTTIASPTGEAVAYITMGSAIVQFLDLATGRAGPFIDTGHGSFGDWAWSPDGRHLATAGADGFVRVWDWRAGRVVTERRVASGHIAGLRYSGDGKHLVVGERAGVLSAIDAQTLEPTGKPVDVAPQLDGDLVLAFAGPDIRTAIALSGSRFALVDLVDGRPVHDGAVGFVPAYYAGFSPDGRRFAVPGIAGELRLLDVESGGWMGPSRVAHGGGTSSAMFAPDGTAFVTGGLGGAVGLWDGRTGARVTTVVPARSDDQPNPRFLPDGHTVLISSVDGTISTWDTRIEHAVEFACQVAGRNLTQNEWRDVFGSRPYRETCPAAA